MRHPLRIALTTIALAALIAPVAAAQPDLRAAIGMAAGLGVNDADAGAALGGTLLFDLTDRVSLEGEVGWLDRGPGADAFSAGASLLVGLAPARASVVPYAAVGGGVHRASYNLGHQRFLGAAGTQFGPGSTVCPAPGAGMGMGPGPGFGAGAATCPVTVAGYWGVGEMPMFYARRLGPLAFPGAGGWGTRTFTDPALAFGGGLRIAVSDRLDLRPDARALVVFGDGDTHTIGVFVVNLGYRF